jgi:hypothetical protein
MSQHVGKLVDESLAKKTSKEHIGETSKQDKATSSNSANHIVKCADELDKIGEYKLADKITSLLTN